MKVWLDAGHGGNDPGASAFGVLEKDWTLDIDNRIANILRYNQIEFERTRVSDITISPSIRATRIRNSGADYCISSHINSGGGEGAETIHSIHSEKGMGLARLILDELGMIGLTKRRFYSREGANGDFYYMHRETGAVTTIIVEYGFIDNSKDHLFLSQGGNRQKCAEAVVKGLFAFEGINYRPLEDNSDNGSNQGPEEPRTLRMGDRGERVKQLQRDLMRLGYPLERYGADGIFGEETRNAVIQFQKDHGLLVDGIVGPQTLDWISKLLAQAEGGKLYRIIVDGNQIGAFEMHSNILNQVESHLNHAKRIIIEQV